MRDRQTGEVAASGTHGDALLALRPGARSKLHSAGDVESGFLTEGGRFLTREQALKEADVYTAEDAAAGSRAERLGGRHLNWDPEERAGGSRVDAATRARLARLGRGGDAAVGHLTPGEVVVPRSLAQLARALLAREGKDVERFTVGGPGDRVNPRTGLREYLEGPGGEGDPTGGSSTASS